MHSRHIKEVCSLLLLLLLSAYTVPGSLMWGLVCATLRHSGLQDRMACVRVQVSTDAVDEAVVNAREARLQLGSSVERTADRISLTVRRVLRVRHNLLRL